MNELFEKLKSNENHRIYADMSPEEQACLRENRAHLQNLVSSKTGTEVIWQEKYGYVLQLTTIYRIDPDYKPEPESNPEYVDLQITRDEEWLGVWGGINDNPALPHYRFYRLYELVAWKSDKSNFEHFWYGDDNHLLIEAVARYFDAGRTVYVRLRVS